MEEFPWLNSVTPCTTCPPHPLPSSGGADLPVVQLRTGRAMGIDWRLIRLLWLVESEAVVAAVPGSLELLQEEEDSVVNHAQHAQSTDS